MRASLSTLWCPLGTIEYPVYHTWSAPWIPLWAPHGVPCEYPKAEYPREYPSEYPSEYPVSTLQRDWQTEAMSQRKYKINADHRFYKQEYCGCK